MDHEEFSTYDQKNLIAWSPVAASVLDPKALPFLKPVNIKEIQPFSFQSMWHILVQGSSPCREEMAFLLGLRCEF